MRPEEKVVHSLSKGDYDMLMSYHGDDHAGRDEIIARLHKDHKEISGDIIRYFLKTCKCAKMKQTRKKTTKKNFANLDLGRYPMHVIAIDVYGYHQEKFLTLLDLCSDRLFAKFWYCFLILFSSLGSEHCLTLC